MRLHVHRSLINSCLWSHNSQVTLNCDNADTKSHSVTGQLTVPGMPKILVCHSPTVTLPWHHLNTTSWHPIGMNLSVLAFCSFTTLLQHHILKICPIKNVNSNHAKCTSTSREVLRLTAYLRSAEQKTKKAKVRRGQDLAVFVLVRISFPTAVRRLRQGFVSGPCL